MKTKVIFEYDENFGKWEVIVQGAISELEALHAFNSVILTAQLATPRLKWNKAEPTDIPNEYKISVGIWLT